MDMTQILAELNGFVSADREKATLVEELVKLRRMEARPDRIFELENELEYRVEGISILLVDVKCQCGSVTRISDGLVVKRTSRTSKGAVRWTRPPIPQPHLTRVQPILTERIVDGCLLCLGIEVLLMAPVTLILDPNLPGVYSHGPTTGGPKEGPEDPPGRSSADETRPCPLLTNLGQSPTRGLQQFLRIPVVNLPAYT